MRISEKVARFLDVIRQEDGSINSFISLNENALREAKAIEKKIESGRAGKLAGFVISVKDNISVAGMRCTSASRMLENYVAPYDATVIEKIRREDGLIIGKANMDEFAAGSSGESSFFGPTRNPRDTKRVPGGSSSGPAASLAAGFCDLSLGSDTGGSIRCPAAFCGVVGVKPTYGRVSRYGLHDLAMSLEQIGPLASNVRDAALLLSVIAGADDRDATTATNTTEDYAKYCNKPVRGLKIGVAEEFFSGVEKTVERDVRQAIEKLKELGAREVDVKLPHLGYGIDAYYLNVFAEFSSALQKLDGLKYGFRADNDTDLADTVARNRSASFGTEVKRRVLLGTYVTMKEYRGKWYSMALRARGLIKDDFERALRGCDVIAGPTMPTVPWRLGEKINDPLAMYLSDILTVSANLAGIPAGSVPVKTGGLPVGMQLHAKPFEEGKIIQTMSAYESAG